MKTEVQRNHELTQQLTTLKSKLKESTSKHKQLQKDHARLLDKKLEGDRRINTLQQKLQQLKSNGRNNSSSAGGSAAAAAASGAGSLSEGFRQGSGGGGDAGMCESAEPFARQQQQQQQGHVSVFVNPLAVDADASAAVEAKQRARVAAEAKVSGRAVAGWVVGGLTAGIMVDGLGGWVRGWVQKARQCLLAMLVCCQVMQ